MTVMRERTRLIKTYGGCIPCLLNNDLNIRCEEHHIVQGMKRLGHKFTYGACPWHHRGQTDIVKYYDGPSMAKDRRLYRERFGREHRILATQNFLLHLLTDIGWEEYRVPKEIAAKVQEFWSGLID